MEQEHKSTNIVWQEGKVSREHREARNRHRGVIVWLTGLSCSGKTTLGIALEQRLFAEGRQCFRLDGDNVRFGLSSDLGFSPEDRDENTRRVGELAKLMADAGFIAITCFISPYRHERNRVRESVSRASDFVEVYLKCSPEVCEGRDRRGLWAKARAGQIEDFTGVSAPYEEPENPEVTLDTERDGVDDCVERIMEHLARQGCFDSHTASVEGSG